MIRKLWLLSVIGGLLASLAWWDKAASLIMLVALVPFIHIFHTSKDKSYHNSTIFLSVLPGFLVFNIITISWLRNASIAGAIYSVLFSTFMMSAIFWVTHLIDKRSNRLVGYLSLISIWLTYEYLSLNIIIFCPWLNLGNVLGFDPVYIQWYEYTGAGGGSLWILLSNILIYNAIMKSVSSRIILNKYSVSSFLIIILPIVISVIKYSHYTENQDPVNIVIVQPNIDPYTEKFNGEPFTQQLNEMVELALVETGEQTDWVIFPETVVDDPFYEKNAHNTEYVDIIDSLLQKYKNINLITGITTIGTYYSSSGQPVDGAENIEGSNIYVALYNSAMHINHKREINFYHKSKLVPGIEKKINIIPPALTKFLAPDMGGTMSGYGTQEERETFTHHLGNSISAPLICYESVFGEFCSQFVINGADMFFILTNDGWWENTAGYKQHLMFASLRAIENRRSIARAANTGISCFIDQRGIIIKQTGWWSEEVLSGSINKGEGLTFYARHGDYILRYATIFSIIVLILIFIAIPIRRLRSGQNFSA